MEKKIKLDKNKITSFKNRKYKKTLSLEISTEPQSRTNKQSENYICITDEFYAFDYYNPKDDIKHGIGITLFALILHFGVGGSVNDGPFIITSIILLFGLSFILKSLFIKNQKLVLDRMQGLFSYPNYWSNSPVILYFKEAIFIFAYKGKIPVPTLMAPYSNWKINGFCLAIVNAYRQLSLFVWYMDKNRPLPPGSAFDPYREKDFQRRKAEGFPPPLYYSNGILTPEATPEQQNEREQYWKDREYFAPPIDRPKNSEIFNIRTHKKWKTCKFSDGNKTVFTNTWYEFTFKNKKIVYMLTDENGNGYLPSDETMFESKILKIKDRLF